MRIRIARLMRFAPGTIICFDRGYTDYDLFSRWNSSGVYFVTKLKSNALFEVLDERVPPMHSDVISDQLIKLEGNGMILRKVTYWDEESEDFVSLICNKLDLGHDHCENTDRPLADRDILPQLEAALQNQNIRGYKRERRSHTDLDSIDSASNAKICLRLYRIENLPYRAVGRIFLLCILFVFCRSIMFVWRRYFLIRGKSIGFNT